MRNQVGSHEEWLKARLELLAAEKDAIRPLSANASAPSAHR
jgi:predicted dithiol-disulfide oxidoreductase (DUF899 family)